MSVLILARLLSAVSDALEVAVKIDRIVCWLDSKIVLWWIIFFKQEFVRSLESRVGIMYLATILVTSLLEG